MLQTFTCIIFVAFNSVSYENLNVSKFFYSLFNAQLTLGKAKTIDKKQLKFKNNKIVFLLKT